MSLLRTTKIQTNQSSAISGSALMNEWTCSDRWSSDGGARRSSSEARHDRIQLVDRYQLVEMGENLQTDTIRASFIKSFLIADLAKIAESYLTYRSKAPSYGGKVEMTFVEMYAQRIFGRLMIWMTAH